MCNALNELPRLNQSVQSFLQQHEAPPPAVFAANLALEEMITNIIKYGYDDSLSHDIRITLTREPGRLTVRIEDDGHEFNPLSQPPPDTSPQIEKRKIGGLGIHLVRRTVDAMWYRRREGRNLLEMIIRLPSDTEPAAPSTSNAGSCPGT